ncbi:SOS response-associated peptidase [uncultured Flavobacterium sp.]|uniref:SOS response-associated peptidase n=1 Tax=uncultured Flavobacterium sp. TaxID=165435 RepID=UPI002599FC28|nr:SOS response-associated peptidase [uncultured Flavobacterium sp.]
MCNYTEQLSIDIELEERFDAKIDEKESLLTSPYLNGFANPNIPIITEKEPKIIHTDYSWGLIPFWAKNDDFKSLNAVIETAHEKPSFRSITQNRCLIIATGFFEWHWNDEKGRSKDKYKIQSDQDEIFSFAGFHNHWVNPDTGEIKNTFTMCTTVANELMEYIHNHKKRMPVVLSKEDESKWLDPSTKIIDFAFPAYDIKLKAKKIS